MVLSFGQECLETAGSFVTPLPSTRPACSLCCRCDMQMQFLMRSHKFNMMLISYVKLLYYNRQFKYEKGNCHRGDGSCSMIKVCTWLETECTLSTLVRVGIYWGMAFMPFFTKVHLLTSYWNELQHTVQHRYIGILNKTFNP